MNLPALPCNFGGYELLEEIGRGGYGVIYKARQPELDRLCAVKMLLDERFRLPHGHAELLAEARLAARLDHPHIVGIYEVDEAEGRPFFSMEFVEGQNLAAFTRRQVISAQRVAQYAQKIAAAVQYAHLKGVLHCDLKPANVLIDHNDEPQLTDFGLSRLLGRDDRPEQASGSEGAGSPNFMAPEQASSRFGDVGRHTDVFGLGATLYYLLTDRPPFRGETAEDTIRAVLELDPVPPRSLRTGVPLDLETICLKCLEKRPSRRYASAQEVADELGRFLRDEPVHARPIPVWQHWWRRARRHPWLTGFATATAVLVMLVAVGSSIAAYRINEARQAAERERQKAVSAENVTRENLYAADLALAFEALNSRRDSQVRDLLNRQIPSAGESDLRGWEWDFLNQQAQPDFFRELRQHTGEVYLVSLLPQGRHLLSSDSLGGIILWDVATGQPIKSLEASPQRSPTLALNRTGTQFAVVDRGAGISNALVRILDLPGFTTNASFTVPGLVRPLAFSPHGDQLWLGSGQRWLAVGLPDGRILKDHQVPFKMDQALYTFSPDGQRLMLGDRDGQIYLLNPDTGRVLARQPGHEARAVWNQSPYKAAFSPDGHWLATGGGDGTVRLWDGTTLEPKGVLRGHQDLVFALAFSPDGTRLISAGRDPDLLVWDLASRQLVGRLKGNPALARHLEFLPDGQSFLTAGNDQVIRQWHLRPLTRGPEVQLVADPNQMVVLSASEDHYLMGNRDQDRFRVFRLRDHTEIASGQFDADSFAGAVHVTPAGQVTLAEVFPDGRLRWKTQPNGPPIEIQSPQWIPVQSRLLIGLDFSLDGKYLATSDSVNGLLVWRLADQKLVTRVDLRPVSTFRFSPGNRWLVAASAQGRVISIDLENGTVRDLATDAQQIPSVNFSPDGRAVATAGIDGVVRLFDLESGKLKRRLRSRAGVLVSTALTADGSRIFGGSLDGLISIWDGRTGRELGVLGGPTWGITNGILSLAVTAEGDLVSTSSDAVRRWRVPRKSPP